MADKEITFETKGARKAAEAMDDVHDSSKRAGEGLDDTAKSTKKTTKTTAALTKGLLKAAAAFGTLKKGMEAFAQQEAAIGRLQRSFSRAGGEAESYAQTIEILEGRSRDLGVSFNEQVDGLSQLIDASGDLRTAHSDLALAADIAAQENIELATAVEMLRKARNGEVTRLKQLDGINKDLAQSLDRVEDATLRGEKAVGLLTKQYSGAAKELTGMQTDMDRLANEINEDLLPAIGNLTTAFVGEDGLLTALGSFGGILDADSSPVSRLSDQINGLGNDIKALVNDPSFETFGNVMFSGFRGLGRFTGALDDGAPKGGPLEGAPDIRPGAAFGMDEPLPVPEGSKPSGKPEKKSGGGPDTRTGFTGATGVTDEDIMAEVDSVLEQAAEREQEFADQRALRANNAKQEQIAIWKEEQEAYRDRQEEIQKLREEDAEHQKKISDELKKAREDQARAEQDLAVAGVAASGQLAQAFIKDEAAKAVISGAIATARSIQAFAPPDVNIPGGVMQAAAAAQFFAAAAMAGKGGGAKSKMGAGGGGGGRGAGSASSSSPSASEREAFTLAGEGARSQMTEESRPLVIHFNTTFPPSPQQAREAARAVESDQRNRI